MKQYKENIAKAGSSSEENNIPPFLKLPSEMNLAGITL
jgi:hypothetical protein